MSNGNHENMDQNNLLLKLNNKDKLVFAEIYSLFFNELYYYSSKLFKGCNVEPEDLIQDLFINVWSNDKIHFDSMDHLKNYLYLAIRNKFKDHYTHQKYIDEYEFVIRNDEDYHITSIVESEVYSAVNEAVSILPSECAKVFRLYTEGWEISDIAEKLNKAPSTVYNQRNRALSILKKELSNKNFVILITFF